MAAPLRAPGEVALVGFGRRFPWDRSTAAEGAVIGTI